MTDPWDVIIIGGGLAGSTAAAHIAKVGKSVLLIEKQSGPHHKVCGEFISIEAQGELAKFGVDLNAMQAHAINMVQLSNHHRTASSTLPFIGRSLSRFKLDAAVLDIAVQNGTTFLDDTAAAAVSYHNRLWQITTSRGEVYKAPVVMLATGKHDLRGFPRVGGKQTNLIGFKILLQPSPAALASLQNTVELALFPGGYAGIECIEENQVNLCLLVTKRQFAACGKSWPTLLNHMIAQSPRLRFLLQDVIYLWDKPLAIANLPYGYVFPGDDAGNFYRLGDQMAVIPSFSGDGMAIALYTASQASTHYLENSGSIAFHKKMNLTLNRQIRIATWLSRLAVNPGGQWLIMAVGRVCPALLSHIALITRIKSD